MKGNGVGDEITREIAATVERIKPLLADKHPFVPGAVLADLTALWISHHIMPDDDIGQRMLWEEILEAHIRTIRELIEYYAEELP